MAGASRRVAQRETAAWRRVTRGVRCALPPHRTETRQDVDDRGGRPQLGASSSCVRRSPHLAVALETAVADPRGRPGQPTDPTTLPMKRLTMASVNSMSYAMHLLPSDH